MMLTGLDQLARKPELAKSWGRCGLVSNQASTTKDFVPAWKVMAKSLTALFGPQHGFESTVQENMIESGHAHHLPTGLPVYSLYSETREPTEVMLEPVDTIVVDLQVTGCRIYTYKYTLSACLRAAKKFSKKVVVLDRHNPLGGVFLEGNRLEEDARSFVGEFAMPMRHGLTMGEAAKWFNQSIGAELEVIPLEGWNPTELWSQYQRQWILTSPNLQCLDAAYCFPGMVLLEGTNLSEGRGTTLPFQLIGAPYIKSSEQFVARIHQLFPDLKGAVLRPTSFQPVFHKWAGKDCNGMQVHVTDPRVFQSYRLALATLRTAIEQSEQKFLWRDPPYEYEYKHLPIEILLGKIGLHHKFSENSFSVHDDAWTSGSEAYRKEIESGWLMYPRQLRLV
jgi:uncharacterized protein YbbC (DUF1343 family)